MPILVRELVVRANVEEANDTTDCATQTPSTAAGSSAEGGGETENILAVCMEKIMENMDLRKER